jgi:hypothetical protein
MCLDLGIFFNSAAAGIFRIGEHSYLDLSGPLLNEAHEKSGLVIST